MKQCYSFRCLKLLSHNFLNSLKSRNLGRFITAFSSALHLPILFPNLRPDSLFNYVHKGYGFGSLVKYSIASTLHVPVKQDITEISGDMN